MKTSPICRGAFSLVELLVVVAIIAVLIGILIPALQQAMESANRATCQSNLHQWGVALHNYHNVYHSFPAGSTERCNEYGQCYSFSVQAQVLPFFEEFNRYNTIDFDQLALNSQLPENLVRIFRCPSDSAKGDDYTSYLANCGTWVDIIKSKYWSEDDQMWVYERSGWDGVFGPTASIDILAQSMPWKPLPPVRIEDITDGTGNTSAMSESCANPNVSDRNLHENDPRSSVLWWQGSPPRSGRLAAARADLLARANTATVMWNLPKGGPWTFGSPYSTWYNHILPPNQPSWFFGLFMNADMERQITTASSYHARGVNVLFCDGRVLTVSARVDPDLWSGLGTRAGGEGHVDIE